MNRSFFLFARPSFLSGVAHLLDFAGTLKTYNESLSGDLADKRAFSEDWKAIGEDLRSALLKYRTEQTHNG